MSGTYVYICQTCKHYDHYGTCRICGCGNPDPEEVRQQNMVVIEGEQLKSLIAELADDEYGPPRKLRIRWGQDHVCTKINEHMWSAPIGKLQEPY